MADSGWQIFDIEALSTPSNNEPVSYREFLNVPSMHGGIYSLAKGSQDMQAPHDEDEIYYVVKGKAQLKVGGEEYEITPGSVMYIKATEEHAFFDIEEDMVLLVLFAAGSSHKPI